MSGVRVAVFLAVRQLLDRWRLNMTAVGGIALGVLVFICMSGVMNGFQQEFMSQILRVAPHARVLAESAEDARPLIEAEGDQAIAVHVRNARSSNREVRIASPGDLALRLQEHPSVVAACPGIEGRTMAASAAEDAGALLLGIDPQHQDACTPLSSFVVAGDWASLEMGRSYCALGVGLADTLGVTVGDRIRLATAQGGSETLIIGALVDTDVPALDSVRVYAPLRTAQGILGRVDVVSHIDIRLLEPLKAEAVMPQLAGLTEYKVESWREANENMLSLFDLQNGIVGLVIFAILLVAGFGILAIQIMLVLQKRRDIAILRAVGLRRADIVLCFLLQGLLVAVAGAILGDVGGAFAVDFLRTLPVQSGGSIVEASGFLVYEAPEYYVWGLVFGSLVGSVAGLVPALQAASVEPVDVLRGQIA